MLLGLHGRFCFGRFGVGDASLLDLGLDVDSEVSSILGDARLAVLSKGLNTGFVACTAGIELC